MWMTTGLAAALTLYQTILQNQARVKRAIREAIDQAVDAVKRTAKQLLRLPKYLIIKSLTPAIFAFDMSVLATNPSSFLLTYNGVRSPLTKTNRAWVNATYGYLRATATPGINQLDEFPYASTAQGGPPLARGCMVPAWENAFQGGTLGAFYRWGKLKGRPGPFMVIPIPI